MLIIDANARGVQLGKEYFGEVHSAGNLSNYGVKNGDAVLCRNILKRKGEALIISVTYKVDGVLRTTLIREDDRHELTGWIAYSGTPNGRNFINDVWRNRALQFLNDKWK
ncbi:hypothetical protein VPHK469_0125 [Vibrio phage K469]